MKIVQINSFSNGSTGKIMMSIHNELKKSDVESYVVWGRGRKSSDEHEYYMDDKIGVYFHALYSRITGKNGFASKRATKKLLNWLDSIKPDIIHLHNIHGYYINIELLFNYIKEKNIKVVWTLHDCWAFTGQCPHFERVKCDKWKIQCSECPLINEYPKTFVDNSKWNYLKKKELFAGLNMEIITPSEWLSNLVKRSFLKEYNIKVINNGIDTNIFKPTESNFRKKYNLENKKIILGVASVWNEKKGFNDFIELSKIIDDNYKIVLVGLNQKQIKKLPTNIIGIARTENQEELAGIYTTADVFFNPTYEDNYPTVNLEAIACGTPVVTYDTGGSFEFLNFINQENKSEFIIKKSKIQWKYSYVKYKIARVVRKNKELKIKNEFKVQKMIKNYIRIYGGEK